MTPVAVRVSIEPDAAHRAPPAREGARLERIRPASGEEESVALEPDGSLVHRVSAGRGWTHRLVPGLRPSFALRARERLVELRLLRNRRVVPSDAETSAPPPASPAVGSVDVVVCTYRRPGAVPALLPRLAPLVDSARAAGLAMRVLVVVQEPAFPEAWLRSDPALGRLPWLSFVRSEPGLPRARNAGVAASVADAVLFVDDDVVPAPELVLGHVEALDAAPRAIGVAGGVDSRLLGERDTRRPDVGQLRASGWVDTNFDSRAEGETLVPDTPIGANMCFRRERMTSVLGTAWFDASLEGAAHREETTTALRLLRQGEFLVFAPRARLLHLEDVEGGCENRASVSVNARHVAQDQLFFRRFYADVAVVGPLLPFLVSARALRQAPREIRRALLRAHLGGWAAARRTRGDGW